MLPNNVAANKGEAFCYNSLTKDSFVSSLFCEVPIALLQLLDRPLYCFERINGPEPKCLL